MIHPQDEDPSRSALGILHEEMVTSWLKLIIFDLPAPSHPPFSQTLAKVVPLEAAANIQPEPWVGDPIRLSYLLYQPSISILI